MEKTDQINNEKAIIIGAGPAGLTAAYEFLKKTSIHPMVMEESNEIGGISKTINYNGNRIDIGGHRFFSKNEEIMEWWQHIMPIQDSPSYDSLLLKEASPNSEGKKDPEKVNEVMLIRQRVSRIFYLRKFFDYPISLKLQTFINMGFIRTMRAGFGYINSTLFKREEKSLEDFYINRFGKSLYKMFFEDYTEKVWGIHPSKLGADWGSQRVKGLSIMTVLKNMFAIKNSSSSQEKQSDINQKNVETSLIERFLYPKYGPGHLWETVANEVRRRDGDIFLNHKVTRIHVKDWKVKSIDVEENGLIRNFPCNYLLSSMPIKDLIAAISDIEIPQDVQRIAQDLPYRDFITVGVLVNKLMIKNLTKIKTWKKRIPDTWIYIQERDVKIGRLQIFNNWSPYMVKDYQNTMWIGLEYFCSEGDEMWNMDKQEFIDMAIDELEKIDILDKKDVLDATQIKVRKAYPSYFGTYYELDNVIKFVDKIENLYCIGRNGQHRYNNMDHSMLTAMITVDNIKNKNISKKDIWKVNTEEGYHESKSN